MSLPPADSAHTASNDEERPRVYVAAYALCVDDGRILLAHLTPSEADPDDWTLPGGGLNWGEDPLTGVLRELDEEAGLTGQVTGIAGIFSATYPRSPTRRRPVHHIGIVYTVEAAAGELRNEEHGSTDYCAWVRLDEAADLPLVPLAEYGLDLARQVRRSHSE